MKMLSFLLLVLVAVGFSGAAYAESNPLAVGVEKVTHAPVAGLQTVSEHLFSPVKEVNAHVLGATDEVRGFVVRMGLNLGQPVE